MVELINNEGKAWLSFADGSVKGFAFEGERLLEKESLYGALTEAINRDSLADLLVRLNGNFAAVITIKNQCYLIVDKLRSYPLFYSGTHVSDVGEHLLKTIPSEIDEVNAYELLSLGYLSGASTLVNGIKSVVAGSYVVINTEDGSFSSYDYFSHIYKKVGRTKEEIFKLSQERLEAGFQRMLGSLKKNQPLLIPLSGGYDSMLIACLCKKFGLENVTCFTYGREDSFEVAISKKVASALGYKWYFVEYSEEVWNRFLSSKDFLQYCHFAGNLTANPHFQDLPALLKLKEQGVITPDMVVIPGHSGDLLGGSKIPVQILEGHLKSFRLENLSRLIFDNFFDLNVLNRKYKQIIIAKINSELQEYKSGSLASFLDNYECYWFVKSKVANFLVNSMRGYEYVGLDWRLPLWDDEYVKVWYEVDWKEKFYSNLYNEFMFENYFKKSRVAFIKNKGITNTGFVNQIKKILPSFLNQVARECLQFIRSMRKQKNVNAFDDVAQILYSMISSETYDGIKRVKRGNINAAVAYYYLDLLKNNHIGV